MNISLLGRVFGRLTVTGEVSRRNNRRVAVCQCECGAVKNVLHALLANGHTQSCGCLRAEIATARMTKHSHNQRGLRTAEYRAWANMKQRCTNPKSNFYRIYGGRGIEFCQRWMVFSNFLADMGTKPSPKHTLERKNTNEDYCKENCEWALPAVQCRNKRTNVYVEFQNKRVCISDLADAHGIKRTTLRYRLLHGWPVESAVQSSNLHSMTKGK